MFPEEKYELLNYTPRREDLNRRKSNNSYKPDFLFKREDNEEEFYVECKYRTYYSQGKVTICDYERLEQYKNIEYFDKKPIYIIIGLNGEPEKPDRIFMIPVEKAYPETYIKYLEQYEIKTRIITYTIMELIKETSKK